MDKRLFDEMLRRAAPRGTMHGSQHKSMDPKLLEGYISRATYTGPREDLQGKTALYRQEFGKRLFQFDDTTLPGNLGHGWHEFPMEHFIYDVEVRT